MKTNLLKKISAVGGVLLCTALAVQAQQRGGGGFGGGGFGGFGGFGGGGFGGGGNNANRTSASTTAYNNNGAVGSATITVDPQTHNLVVIADETTAEQIRNVVQNLDAPKRQVLIKVVFLEVQRNDGSDIGIEGGYQKNDIGSGIAGSAANAFGLAGANSLVTNFSAISGTLGTALSPNSAGAANGIYQLATSDFQVTLKAIANAGRAEILSRPSILARDGQLAKIVVGQSAPLPTSVSYQAAGNTTVPIVNVTYTDVGIILNVTPFIGANGLVEMIVQPQISSIDGTKSQAIGNGASAPYLNIRSADTVVVTPDAEPVVIGGLISNESNSSDKKIPFLGDIPLLGNLFKTSAKSAAKSELMIFLTPHIVESPRQLAGISAGEQRQTPIIKNSISEKELDRFLERLPAKKKK